MRRTGVSTNKLLVSMGLVGIAVSPALAVFSWSQPKKIVIEIETGKVTKPFKVVDEATASGGKWVMLEEKVNKRVKKRPGQEFYEGSIEIKFGVEKEADYVMWVRAWWMDGCGNSVFATVDKRMTAKHAMNVEGSTYKNLLWFKLDRKIHLKQGSHVLRLQNREDGIRLDEVVFMEFEEDVERQLVPAGAETPTQAPGL